MNSVTAAVASTTQPPSPAAHANNQNMSSATAIFCFVALLIIPMISYTFFVAMKCHRNPFRRRSPAAPAVARHKVEKLELVYGVSYTKAGDVVREEAPGNSERCPVCLCGYSEGEEIRQLGECKHAFHIECIDMWLFSHSNCPVCRAAVPVKRLKAALVDGEDHLP